MGNPRIAADLSLALYYKTLDFEELHFLKESLKTHENLPLSWLLDPGHRSFPRSQHPAMVQEGLSDKGMQAPLTSVLPCMGTATQAQRKPCSSMPEICLLSFEFF